MIKNEQGLKESQIAARKEYIRLIKKRYRVIIAVLLVIICLMTGALAYTVPRAFRDEPVNLSLVKAPDWIDQQFLKVNPYSRPGDKIGRIKNIVVHYTANPGSTAVQNRNYFDSLADQKGDKATSVSSHFVVGIDGEIVQCIPIDEISYASYPRNADTISIECCHSDTTGEFSKETFDSVVKLTAWLCRELNLDEKDVIRHYDVSGKNCPKYYVENEDDWKTFRKDVKKYIKSGTN